uniref:Uncharacterized protein n=1 Tax=Theileria annulata TaxID=5874 RepID=A0A3B0N4Z3_THEAN
MNYNEKITQGFASVLCTDKLIFVGLLGPNSRVSIFKFQDGSFDIKFVGFLSPLIGTVTKMFFTKNGSKLICKTNCGYIYVWDISHETINTLESLTNNPLYIDGYIPIESRVTPVAIIEPNNSADCADVDLLYNDTLMVVEKWPELNINLYDYSKGSKLTTFSSLLGDNFDKKKYVRSLKADSQMATLDGVKGQWVAVGTESGTLHLCFLPEFDKPTEETDKSDFFKELNESLKTYSFNLMENVDINTLGWRFRNKTSVNLTVLCGCSDGTVRCCIINSETSQLKLSKNVSYSYSKASISGTVNRIICVRDNKNGTPFVIGSCNIIGEIGNFEFGDLATNCVFEGIYQRLTQEFSDDIVSFAKVQDFITDLCISPQNNFVILVSSNENVYLCNENTQVEERGVGRNNSLAVLRRLRIYGSRYKIEKIQKLCENFEKACWRSIRVAEESAYIRKYHFLKHCMNVIKLYRQNKLYTPSAYEFDPTRFKLSQYILDKYDLDNAKDCLDIANHLLSQVTNVDNLNDATSNNTKEIKENGELNRQLDVKSLIRGMDNQTLNHDIEKVKNIITKLEEKVQLIDVHGKDPHVVGYSKSQLESMIKL